MNYIDYFETIKKFENEIRKLWETSNILSMGLDMSLDKFGDFKESVKTISISLFNDSTSINFINGVFDIIKKYPLYTKIDLDGIEKNEEDKLYNNIYTLNIRINYSLSANSYYHILDDTEEYKKFVSDTTAILNEKKGCKYSYDARENIIYRFNLNSEAFKEVPYILFKAGLLANRTILGFDFGNGGWFLKLTVYRDIVKIGWKYTINPTVVSFNAPVGYISC